MNFDPYSFTESQRCWVTERFVPPVTYFHAIQEHLKLAHHTSSYSGFLRLFIRAGTVLIVHGKILEILGRLFVILIFILSG
jgi:hypothetical protein